MAKSDKRGRPMAASLGKFRGVIRGNIIELEKDPGLREGDPVEIQLWLNLPPGEGLHRAYGAWAEEGMSLEELLEEMRRIRSGEPWEKRV